ncbi:MAG TPA: hypothetical protein VJ011_08655 [Steroidobacteraceae bacterium]|nr:hypothetical protein [Steroidobacteraceae bacterium]
MAFGEGDTLVGSSGEALHGAQLDHGREYGYILSAAGRLTAGIRGMRATAGLRSPH